MNYCFGDIVVVEEDLIGVVVKSWIGTISYNQLDREPNHDVYVRSYNCIRNYKESEMQRYMVRHKELNEEELIYQRKAVEGI